MGLLNKLGKAALQSAKNGIANSAANSVYNKIAYPTTNVSDKQLYGTIISTPTFSANTINKTGGVSKTRTQDDILKENPGMEANDLRYEVKTSFDNPNYVQSIYEDAPNVRFEIPDWGYSDFVNERSMWQKGLTSPLNDPGWFYFKIFFNFDTQYGLFGGLLNNLKAEEATGSAARYLLLNRNYPSVQSNERYVALHKFAAILSYINSNAPWFFKSIKNLNQADIPQISEFGKERTIELEFNADAIDMRITTMFDLYKYVAYDAVNAREILPDNLRKFDINVMVFESPIKYFQTAMHSNSQNITYKYKSAHASSDTTSEYGNVMSYKLYTFVNCEFNLESLSNLTPNEITNEQPFQLGKGSVKIKYDKCYTHTMNEFFGIMFGSDGVYYNTGSLFEGAGKTSINKPQANRYEAMQNALENVGNSINSNSATKYKDLVDASEAICNFNLSSVGISGLGNIYGEDTVIRKNINDYKNNATNSTNTYHYNPNVNTQHATLNKTQTNDLYKYKLEKLKSSTNFFATEGVSLLSKWLGASYTYKLGNIYDHDPYTNQSTRGSSNQSLGDYNMGVNGTQFNRYNSEYLKDKLATLHGNPNKYTNTEYDRFYKKKIIDVDNVNVIRNDNTI